ncbi:MAG: Rrf2 family transcriptional regulator [Armatimonadetes bacterium]|nr:Rrf2 family transcriptional regulator [Armatimonadota bacterium]
MREGLGAVQLAQIAKSQTISPKYLEQLFIPLRNAGLVRSERGPKGGYVLARLAADITVLEIVRAVEGPLDLLDCVGKSRACDKAEQCAARELWKSVSEAVTAVLDKRNLKTLADKQRKLSGPTASVRVRVSRTQKTA